MRVKGEGPIPTRIMLVGEAPGEQEESAGTPFVGPSGMELNRMLQEAGIMRSECYVTNVIKVRPPNNQLHAFIARAKKDITPAHKLFRDRWVTKEVTEGYAELLTEIKMVEPNLIIAFGNIALWALTGRWGIMKWRGSLLQAELTCGGIPGGRADGGISSPKIIPTIHPAAILRQWELRQPVVNDLRRAKRHMVSREYSNRPQWKFIIRPSFTQVMHDLNCLLTIAGCETLWIDFDIETRGGHIDCIGLSWSRAEALCIPFMAAGKPLGYWSEEEEARIVYELCRLLTHPQVRIRWQNGLYDAQYVYRNWHFIPRGGQDTMISQHSCFAALPKGLAFLASIYANWYQYWKDEGKIVAGVPEDQRWRYNLQDCIYTREVGEVLTETAASLGLSAVDAQQQALFWPVLKAMLRGVRVIPEAKKQMAEDIQEELKKREAFLSTILGHSINPGSPKQMQTLFYEDLRQPAILNRVKDATTGRFIMRPTCDDDALMKIGRREPLLQPLCNCIADIRTLKKFYGDFVMMPLDEDGRMRCSFNIAGDAGDKDAEKEGVKSAPYTYRLSSSKNPFGSGGNLQTIPSEKSKSSGKAAARGSMDFTLPNIRSMYGPDQGFTFFDLDLDRADLQIVGWESGDEVLKAALRLGADIHLLNVYTLDGQEPPPLEELVETHSRYWDYRGPRKHKREFSKVFCHACVTAGHELLTKKGWIPIEHFQETEEIAVWNKETQEVSFEVPKGMYRNFAAPGEKLVAFEGQAYSQEVTSDHKLPYTVDEKLVVTAADSIPPSARLPTTGLYSGPRRVDEAFIRLLAAFQADGFYDYKYRTGWHLKKERKIERLLWLAAKAGLSPNVQVGQATRIFLVWRPVDWMKVPGDWLLELDGQSLDWWLDELKYWDGHQGETGAVTISTSNASAAEWIQTIAHLRGKGSQNRVNKEAAGNRKTNWSVSLNNRKFASVDSMRVVKHTLSVATPVYCPSTSTGFFLVRRNGNISVTGNTDYLGKPKTVAENTGRSIHEIDRAQKLYFARYPGIQRWQNRVIEQVKTRRFVENIFGYRWYIFSRIDDQLMPKAVAWGPQSAVGVLINKIWLAFHEHLPEVQVLLQVHDALAGQLPTYRHEALLPLMRQHSKIIIPYADPLIIPVGIKTSEVSWGECA